MQLRETHENEQEMAYQLKAQIIEVSGSNPAFDCPQLLALPGWGSRTGPSSRLLQTGTPLYPGPH